VIDLLSFDCPCAGVSWESETQYHTVQQSVSTLQAKHGVILWIRAASPRPLQVIMGFFREVIFCFRFENFLFFQIWCAFLARPVNRRLTK
jgi:hypothetical protein